MDTQFYDSLFGVKILSTSESIPEDTDLLTLEIFVQLLDLYLSDLEVELSIEKIKSAMREFNAEPIKPREWPTTTEKIWMGPITISDRTSEYPRG